MTNAWYDPILAELAADYGVKFTEKTVEYRGY
jgi:hypothetical protein